MHDIPQKWVQLMMADARFDITQLLLALAGNSKVGLFFCDGQLRIQFVNDALSKMTGLIPEAHLGKMPSELMGEAAAVVERSCNHVLMTGQHLSNVEVSGQLPTRTESGHWIGTYFPVRNVPGKVCGVVGVVVEITAEKKQQELLRRLGGLSHAHDPVLAAKAKVDNLIQPAQDLLRSWKEIAHYLATSVRTVQRWELEYSLPIHRLDQQRGASVFAFPAELQKWLLTRTSGWQGQHSQAKKT